MAPVSIFLLLLSTFSVVTAQQRYSNISLDSSLSPNTNLSSWLSPSGRFAFGFYPIYQDSFIIAIWFAQIPEKTIIWTANRDDPQVPNNLTLRLTSNRGLVLSSSQGDEKYITDTPESASSASMLDSGNFIIYNSDSKVIWQSFDNPTDTIVQGQRLVAGQELFSNFARNDPRKGRFRLKMQHDGHLVQYPVQTPDTAPYSYWASAHVKVIKSRNNYGYNTRAERKHPEEPRSIWAPRHRVAARHDRTAVISRNLSSRFSQKLPIASVVVTEWVVRSESSEKLTQLPEYECYKLEG